MLNAATGKVIHKIATGAGDGSTPSGLAQINNYVDNVAIDNTTLRVYGGDVLGNMWRFDFTPSADRDADRHRQGCKQQPAADHDPAGARRARRQAVRDVRNRQVPRRERRHRPASQSVYGIRDHARRPVTIYRTRADLLADAGDASRAPARRRRGRSRAAARPRDCARTDGWVLDLAETGERVNVEMKLVLGALVFASNVSRTRVPCSVGGHSWFNQIDFRTGAPIPGAVTLAVPVRLAERRLHRAAAAAAARAAEPDLHGPLPAGQGHEREQAVTPPQPVPVGNRISWREIPQ